MIALRLAKACLLHVPKTGGTSVITALKPYCVERNWTLDPPDAAEKITRELGHQHLGDYHVTCTHATFAESQYFLDAHPSFGPVYAFVRNPWTRLESMAHSLKLKDETFEDFVLRFCGPDPVVRPNGVVAWVDDIKMSQTEWIGEAKPLQFEQLEPNFHGLCEMCNIQHLELPEKYVNRGLRHSYTPRARDAVAELWADDIERWGYEPP